MDLLIAEGALTATQCAAELDDSAASCSYHLRQLARFGFVEEAEGGRGRNRPWRWVPLGNRIVAGDSPAERAAAEALTSVIEAGKLDRIRRYQEQRASDPWHGSATPSAWSIRITEEELVELDSAIAALLAPWQRRTFDGEVRADSRVVDAMFYLMPRPEPRASHPARTRGRDDVEDAAEDGTKDAEWSDA